MKLIQKRIYLVIIAVVLIIGNLHAQQDKSKEAIKKAEKVQKTQEKNYKSDRKKTLKHRWAIQSDQTKQQMKANKKKAKQYDNQGNQSFFEGLFKRKKYKR